MINKLLAYSKKEAAAATSLSVRGIDYLIEKGQLRAVKIGRRVLIPSRELERLIEKGTTHVFQEAGSNLEHQSSDAS
ncbi:MAG TPA: helix-turn-helix domain-containing protein [Terriglobia bacterium]|nr:helix-turn-helix domain-containing protein [Terriglobia bacterium]